MYVIQPKGLTRPSNAPVDISHLRYDQEAYRKSFCFGSSLVATGSAAARGTPFVRTGPNIG